MGSEEWAFSEAQAALTSVSWSSTCHHGESEAQRVVCGQALLDRAMFIG